MQFLVDWHPNIYVFASILTVITGIPMSIFVALRGRDVPATRPFALTIGCGSFWCLFPTLASLPVSEATILLLARIAYLPAGITIAAFLHLCFAVSQDERVLHRRKCLIAAYCVAFLISLTTFSPYYIQDVVRYAPYFAISGGPLYHVLVIFYIVAAGYGIIVTIRNFRMDKGINRNKLRYFLIASIVLGFCPGLHFAASYFSWEPLPHDFMVTLFIGLAAYSIYKHQLLDISIVIRKSLIYSLLVAAITATYLVAVVVIERLFQGFFGYQSIVATVIVAFLIATFFNPVRNRIQTFVDRSLFKATTAELAEQREKLLLEIRKAEQQKAVATLAAGMAHEIKNPLTAIKTFTEHLPEKFDSEEFRVKFHKIVGGEVERINHIVQQLLDFSKPVPPKLQPVHIPKLLDETLEFLNNALIERRIEVTKNYDGVSTIQGDPQQLKQVFLNLFLNSIQAMSSNGAVPKKVIAGCAGAKVFTARPERIEDRQWSPAVTRTRSYELTIQTSQSNSTLTITIQDTGCGMSQETLNHLFEPFYTTKPSGTGLGLSVVKGIVEEHGGKVRVESKEQCSTKVRIQLPMKSECMTEVS